MSTKQSLGQRWENSRPSKTTLFWSCAGCVVATIVVGFAWGGWVTGGTASTMAADAASNGRSELAAAVCVDRFKASSDASAQLVALKKLDNWSRSGFIEKGGWATMPGKADAVDGAARLCADKLALLDMPPVATAEAQPAAAVVAQ